MSLKNIIKKIVSFEDLSFDEMTYAMQLIMMGKMTPAQIAGFLVALEMKQPSVDELTAAATVMRQFANKISIDAPLIDIVGTGGDELHTFNISTTAMFVVAAAGAKVAKHGNRSISSHSGSADVLEYAGVNLDLTPHEVKQCIEQIGIGFLFAPTYHHATKHAVLPRKELGIRTFFNLLGPLTNPADATSLMIGVFDKKWLLPVAKVLQNLDCQRALIVHSQDGLDEISLSAKTDMVELHKSTITASTFCPSDIGFNLQPLSSIQVDSVNESFELMQKVLNNISCPARDIVILNAGAAIYIAGLTRTLNEGINLATELLAKNAAMNKFKELVNYTQHFKGQRSE